MDYLTDVIEKTLMTSDSTYLPLHPENFFLLHILHRSPRFVGETQENEII